jgi:integrase
MHLRKISGSTYWYVECRDLNGRRSWVSTKQTDKTAATRAGRAIQLARSVPGLPKYALAAALVDLTKHKERKRVSAAELDIVKQKGGRLIEHFGPARDLHTIKPADVDGYVDARRKCEVRPGKPISDVTIGYEIKYLREAARVAKRAGRYHGDPDSLRTSVLAPAVPRSTWLTYEQFLALLTALGDESDGRARGRAELVDYVLVFCHTGTRRRELYSLTAKSLDKRGRRLFIVGRKGSADHRERWVPLSDAAFEVLTRRAAAVPAGAPLFRARPGSNLITLLRRACRRAGVPEVTPNDLRRSYVTWHLTAGTSERETQRFVGHSPRSPLVRRVYGQLIESAGQRAVAGFPAPEGASEVSQQVSQTEAGPDGQNDDSADEHAARSA